jgi:hypothetical protein
VIFMGLIGFLLITILLGIYFLPVIIAGKRQHRNFAPIAALTILAGWTFVGWVGAFVWALTDQSQR